MPEERERPRPHGDPMEPALDPEPEGDTSDRARGAGSTANGIPEFDEDSGDLRKRQYDDGAEIVSETD